MIVSDPMGAGEVSGTSLASTFKSNRGVRVLQGRPCSNPRDSEVRRLANALMAAGNHAWVALSEAERVLWRGAAGPGTHGQAEFVGRYCRVHRIVPGAPNPVLGFRSAPAMTDVDFQRYGGVSPEIDLAWSLPGDASWWVALWGQVLASAGRQPDQTRWKLWGCADSQQGGLYVIPDPYPGMLIVCQIRLVDVVHGQGWLVAQLSPTENPAYVMGPHAPSAEAVPAVPREP